MSELFDIENGVLLEYHGKEAHVTIPDGVTAIGKKAFWYCWDVTSVTIPNSVRTIGEEAFHNCAYLTSITIPDSVTEIGRMAFCDCKRLNSLTIPDSVTEIGEGAFSACHGLTSFEIPSSVTEIRKWTFDVCVGLTSIVIPEGVTKIGEAAFGGCKGLTSVSIPSSVTEIGKRAFCICPNLSEIVIPDSVATIGEGAFECCTSLSSLTVPAGVTQIGSRAFEGCENMSLIAIPESVTEIGAGAFDECPVTVVCPEGSHAHEYCLENHIAFVFDYQYEAFGGLLPQGFEKLASPFLADEEGPYVFVSYSHRDRDEVLPIIEGLYEDGWRVWYDEGLTIGDRYDETLEEHVRNCAAFLIFLTPHSRQSAYIRDNEVPWAERYGRPVVECALDGGAGYGARGVVASAPSAGIGRALEDVEGLAKGEPRVAKGISVVVDPAARSGGPGGANGGFAYCLYSTEGAAAARAVLLEARRAGCALYDAVEGGMDLERLKESACLVAFLDGAYLRDVSLTGTLARKYLAGRDVAVCALEDVEDVGLPQMLARLYDEQWLDFAHGISADMCTKLARHLQARGCRDVAVLPGFDYEETDGGIVITRYTGLDPNPRIEGAYGGVPVVEIADGTFENCVHLEAIAIPNGVMEIGDRAFRNCTVLSSVDIPDGVTRIGAEAFRDCTRLTSIVIPDGVAEIGEEAFAGCSSLSSVEIPDSVTEIGYAVFNECESLTALAIPAGVTAIEGYAFSGCKSLSSVDIPDGVAKIGMGAFIDCKSLVSVDIPDGVTEIGTTAFSSCSSLASASIPGSVATIEEGAFRFCSNLASVTISDGVNVIGKEAFSSCSNLASIAIPDSVAEIGLGAFSGCSSLTSLTIPDRVTRIGPHAFAGCNNLTITCPQGSYASKYCADFGIPTMTE